jgi:hypothetical protein
MPPKHRQLHAPRAKASANAYHALVDPPHDGKRLSFDGGDEQTDGYDSNTTANVNLRDSGPPAPTPSRDIVLQWIGQNILNLEIQIQARATRMESALATASEDNARLNSKVDSLLQKMDAAWTENTALREAYHASREETAALKAAVDALTKILDENIATNAPPSPDTVLPHSNGDPPPAFATTRIETIDFSIGVGLAALCYVSL